MKQKAQLKQITATKHAAKWTKLCSCRLHWYIHQLQKKSLTHRIVVSLQPGVALAHRLKVRTSHRALCTISASPVHNDSPPSVCCALKCSADMHYLAVPWCWPAPLVPIDYGFYSFRVSLFFLPDASGLWIHPLSELSLHYQFQKEGMENRTVLFLLCSQLAMSFFQTTPSWKFDSLSHQAAAGSSRLVCVAPIFYFQFFFQRQCAKLHSQQIIYVIHCIT